MKNIMMDTAHATCGLSKGPCRQNETWWWNEDVAEAESEKKKKPFFSTVHFPDRLTDRPTDGLGEKPVLIPTYALLTIATWLIITLVGYLRNESGMVIMLMEFGQPLQQNQRWTADNTLPKNCPSSVSSSSGKRSGSTDFINPPFWHESSMLLTVIGSD